MFPSGKDVEIKKPSLANVTLKRELYRKRLYNEKSKKIINTA